MPSEVSIAGADQGREPTVEDLKRELAEAHRREAATAEILKVISRSATHLQPVLDVIIATASRLCQSECAYLFTLQNGKFVLLAYDSGVDSEFLEYLKKNPIDPEQRGSITARAAREGRTIHISDSFADPEYGTGPITAAKRRTVLSVPLLREGTTVGVISLDRKEVKPFTITRCAHPSPKSRSNSSKPLLIRQ